MSLIKKAENLKKMAKEILAETNLKSLLSEIGIVNVVGSFKLNVMCQPDIDLTVNSDNPSLDKANEITNRLIDSGKFQSVVFTDMYNYNLEGKSKGFYWGLKVGKDGTFWKIDIWYSTKEEDFASKSTLKFEKLLNNNPEKREIILNLKNCLKSTNYQYKHGVSGSTIYNVVLNKNITSIEEFEKGFLQQSNLLNQ